MLQLEQVKFWLLQPIDPDAGYWEAYWDRPSDFLVAAEDEKKARLLVSEACQRLGGARGAPWNNPAQSLCAELTVSDILEPKEMAKTLRHVPPPERYPVDRRRRTG